MRFGVGAWNPQVLLFLSPQAGKRDLFTTLLLSYPASHTAGTKKLQLQKS